MMPLLASPQLTKLSVFSLFTIAFSVLSACNMMEHLAAGLMYPNESIKAAVCYLYGKLYSVPSAAERLFVHFTERLCGLFLTTLKNSQTKELQVNCLGLLKQLLKYDKFVSVIMSNSGKGADSASPELFERESPLPLMIKKLLLSRDEVLQVASAQCMAAVLVHSPATYAPAFINADIPEFLFECLFCMSEILTWSIYCCLLLLTEEQLFFSKCHTVYGIEPILRSLKEILHLNNVELQKQGLLLFTEILKWQPAEIKLFTNTSVFKDAVSVLLEALNCPILEVAAEAVKAVAAILRKDHVTIPPVLYRELQKLVEGVLKRCSDLPLKSFPLISIALESFRNACRLAVESQNDPVAQENSFTAPNSENEDTLKSFSEFLLRISDSLCIPIVMKYSERAVHPALMEVLISTLNILFSVMPDSSKRFSMKLGKENRKRLFSIFLSEFLILHDLFSLSSNPGLNHACSSFLHSICLNLHSSSKKPDDSSQEVHDLSELLQKSLPQLNFGIQESLSLLSETPDSFCLDETLRSHQYSFLLLFYFAFSQGDKFVPETELFSAIRSFLLSIQDQGDCPPPYVFKAVLYLLAICQDKTEALDLASLSAIRRILDSISDLSLVYVHHPLLLNFFLRYPELMGRFGHRILHLWLSCEDYSHTESEDTDKRLSAGFSDSLNNFNSLLCMLKGNPSALLVLLDLVCVGTSEVAHKVLITLKAFLKIDENAHVCDLLRSQFLQILQNLLVENNSSAQPLLLNLLFLVQLRHATERELDSTDFRLLHLVSNLSGKCSPTDHEILQPSLNYLYWSLQQTTPASQKTVVAMLFSNTPLLELLEKIIHLTWLPACSSEPALPSTSEALLCMNVNILQLLRAFFRQNLCSSFVKFAVRSTDEHGNELPQSEGDASLCPVAMRHVVSLVIPSHIVSQPWNKFLLISLLDSVDNSFLHPEILRLVALFIRYQNTRIISPIEIGRILEEAASTKLPELSDVTISALRSFLVQVSPLEMIS
uniref:Meiotic double-stranded break formation protein 1 n=1 Tax=Podarcis muralis TaxID=64176 RepID=A0A670K1F0_PODMU